MRHAIVFILLVWLTPVSAAEVCGKSGIALQVLGSGGPELQDKRASSSYLSTHPSISIEQGF